MKLFDKGGNPGLAADDFSVCPTVAEQRWTSPGDLSRPVWHQLSPLIPDILASGTFVDIELRKYGQVRHVGHITLAWISVAWPRAKVKSWINVGLGRSGNECCNLQSSIVSEITGTRAGPLVYCSLLGMYPGHLRKGGVCEFKLEPQCVCLPVDFGGRRGAVF